ncbi:MAG: Crp/Fnr family transcriptional regulator [Bacteroidota bacterium]|nr:Crp/Fnr family transcriptional regulator [Bacteroidota bacterium]
MPLNHLKSYYFQVVPEITEEIWEDMVQKATIQHYKKGEFYISPGEQENFVTFISKGGFRYFSVVEEKELVCEFLFENNYLSEYESFLKRTPAKVFIQALEDSVVVKFHYNDVQECYSKYPLIEKFGRLIAEKFLIDTIERMNSMMASSPEERYNKLAENNPELLQRVPQYMIASYIGVTPEALSRIRRRLVA